MAFPARVVVCECFARDGLQHEPSLVPTETKLAAIELFAELGFTRIEVTSFSHPKLVPQFADAEDVLRRLRRGAGVTYKATCVNEKAVRRAVASTAAGHGPDEISLVVSASERHSLGNVRRDHAQMRAELEISIRLAGEAGLRTTGTIATAFGCPFTGVVTDAAVERWVAFLVERGIGTISLADTTGMGNPVSVARRCTTLGERWPGVTWIGHFHDTRGTGIANCVAAVAAGFDHLDSSFGGLGGHPPAIRYARGDTGNVATEDLVAMLHEMGIETGIAVGRLGEAVELVERAVGHPVPGRVGRAGLVTDLLPLTESSPDRAGAPTHGP